MSQKRNPNSQFSQSSDKPDRRSQPVTKYESPSKRQQIRGAQTQQHQSYSKSKVIDTDKQGNKIQMIVEQISKKKVIDLQKPKPKASQENNFPEPIQNKQNSSTPGNIQYSRKRNRQNASQNINQSQTSKNKQESNRFSASNSSSDKYLAEQLNDKVSQMNEQKKLEKFVYPKMSWDQTHPPETADIKNQKQKTPIKPRYQTVVPRQEYYSQEQIQQQNQNFDQTEFIPDDTQTRITDYIKNKNRTLQHPSSQKQYKVVIKQPTPQKQSSVRDIFRKNNDIYGVEDKLNQANQPLQLEVEVQVQITQRQQTLQNQSKQYEPKVQVQIDVPSLKPNQTPDVQIDKSYPYQNQKIQIQIDGKANINKSQFSIQGKIIINQIKQSNSSKKGNLAEQKMNQNQYKQKQKQMDQTQVVFYYNQKGDIIYTEQCYQQPLSQDNKVAILSIKGSRQTNNAQNQGLEQQNNSASYHTPVNEKEHNPDISQPIGSLKSRRCLQANQATIQRRITDPPVQTIYYRRQGQLNAILKYFNLKQQFVEDDVTIKSKSKNKISKLKTKQFMPIPEQVDIDKNKHKHKSQQISQANREQNQNGYPEQQENEIVRSKLSKQLQQQQIQAFRQIPPPLPITIPNSFPQIQFYRPNRIATQTQKIEINGNANLQQNITPVYEKQIEIDEPPRSSQTKKYKTQSKDDIKVIKKSSIGQSQKYLNHQIENEQKKQESIHAFSQKSHPTYSLQKKQQKSNKMDEGVQEIQIDRPEIEKPTQSKKSTKTNKQTTKKKFNKVKINIEQDNYHPQKKQIINPTSSRKSRLNHQLRRIDINNQNEQKQDQIQSKQKNVKFDTNPMGSVFHFQLIQTTKNDHLTLVQVRRSGRIFSKSKRKQASQSQSAEKASNRKSKSNSKQKKLSKSRLQSKQRYQRSHQVTPARKNLSASRSHTQSKQIDVDWLKQHVSQLKQIRFQTTFEWNDYKAMTQKDAKITQFLLQLEQNHQKIQQEQKKRISTRKRQHSQQYQILQKINQSSKKKTNNTNQNQLSTFKKAKKDSKSKKSQRPQNSLMRNLMSEMNQVDPAQNQRIQENYHNQKDYEPQTEQIQQKQNKINNQAQNSLSQTNNQLNNSKIMRQKVFKQNKSKYRIQDNLPLTVQKVIEPDILGKGVYALVKLGRLSQFQLGTKYAIVPICQVRFARKKDVKMVIQQSQNMVPQEFRGNIALVGLNSTLLRLIEKETQLRRNQQIRERQETEKVQRNSQNRRGSQQNSSRMKTRSQDEKDIQI